MLKLASGYTGISLKSMNELLEKLVEDFGIPRNNVVNDNHNFGHKTYYKKVQTLTDEEYIRLTGVSVIKTIKETRLEQLNGKKFNIPIQYNWTYLSSLAKKDEAKYDFELITRSRTIWMKLLDLKLKVIGNHDQNLKIKGIIGRINTDGAAQGVNITLLSKLHSPHNTADLIDAMIVDGEKLLKRGVLNPKSFEKEMTLRKNIEQKEISKLQSVSMTA